MGTDLSQGFDEFYVNLCVQDRFQAAKPLFSSKLSIKHRERIRIRVTVSVVPETGSSKIQVAEHFKGIELLDS